MENELEFKSMEEKVTVELYISYTKTTKYDINKIKNRVFQGKLTLDQLDRIGDILEEKRG